MPSSLFLQLVFFFCYYFILGAKGDLNFRIYDLVKNPERTDFNPAVNSGEVRRAQLAKSNLFTSTLAPPGIFSDLLRSVRMLRRELEAESNTYSIPGKTAALIPEFAVEGLLSA